MRKCCFAIWLVVLVLMLVGMGARAHHRRHGHGMRGPWGKPHGPKPPHGKRPQPHGPMPPHGRNLQEMPTGMPPHRDLPPMPKMPIGTLKQSPPMPSPPPSPRPSPSPSPSPMSSSSGSVAPGPQPKPRPWRPRRLNRAERRVVRIIKMRERFPIPAELFSLADDRNPRELHDFGDYFKREMRMIRRHHRRRHCRRAWKKKFRRFFKKGGRCRRFKKWMKKHHGRGPHGNGPHGRRPHGKGPHGRRHHGRRHHGREHHRVLQSLAAKDQAAQTILGQSPPKPDPEPERINPLTGLPTRFDREVHSLLDRQRAMHLKKFNIMFKKERWVTFITMHFFNHRHCHGFFFFWAFILPLIACFMRKKCRKKMFRKFRKFLEIENSAHFRRRGYVWSINPQLTELTLKKVSMAEAEIVQTTNPNVSYPVLYTRAHPFDSPEASFNKPVDTEGQPMMTETDRPQKYVVVAPEDQSIHYTGPRGNDYQ